MSNTVTFNYTGANQAQLIAQDNGQVKVNVSPAPNATPQAEVTSRVAIYD
ncbi:hypothetical protein [Bombilactobacillus bombi]|nr:hypothetical protein [Bombilactobacillus bombi]